MLANGTLPFLCAQRHFSDQAAEVLVTRTGGDEQGKAREIANGRLPIANGTTSVRFNSRKRFAGEFCPDMCFDAGSLGGKMEARAPVQAIAIKQSHRGEIQRTAGANEIFGKRSAFEKTECGTGVKFDVLRQ